LSEVLEDDYDTFKKMYKVIPVISQVIESESEEPKDEIDVLLARLLAEPCNKLEELIREVNTEGLPAGVEQKLMPLVVLLMM
jgi:hypothetical protein